MSPVFQDQGSHPGSRLDGLELGSAIPGTALLGGVQDRSGLVPDEPGPGVDEERSFGQLAPGQFPVPADHDVAGFPFGEDEPAFAQGPPQPLAPDQVDRSSGRRLPKGYSAATRAVRSGNSFGIDGDPVAGQFPPAYCSGVRLELLVARIQDMFSARRSSKTPSAREGSVPEPENPIHIDDHPRVVFRNGCTIFPPPPPPPPARSSVVLPVRLQREYNILVLFHLPPPPPPP